ncbi:unnamed protein product [Symbiodinium necroappetens]|uniref:Uncharacterized protein n=1 Tax=Symbiodinium necroappetens TaxID=1628268 RepID=A0A812WQG1_9DINO|nr:unnamed protein product [Symbiodinium necroappetens]
MGAAPCLEHVYGELKAFAKESNLNLHLNQLTRKIISWGSHADYPSGSWFKGADTVVINKFLEAKFTALLGSHDFGNNVGYIQQVDQCLRDANDFMTSLYRAGLFITLKRLKHLVRVGQSMVKGYSQCANLAFRSNLARFKFNPKYHMLCHIIYSLTQELAARRSKSEDRRNSNPGALQASCW